MPKKVIPLTSELKNSKSPFDIIAEISKSEEKKNASGQKVNKTHSTESKENSIKVHSSTTTKKSVEKVSSTSGKKFNQNERDEGEKRRLEKENRPKLNETSIADYDKGGDPVILSHLNADEGQQGNGPRLMMGNLIKTVGIDMNVIVNEEIDNLCPPKFDPREKENELMTENRRMRVYQIGKKLYAKTSECLTQNNDQNMNKKENCYQKFKINDERLSLIGGRNLRPLTCTLGCYGIQLASISIDDEKFPKEIRGKQALDVIFVAHGLNSIKPSVDWAQNDIDLILNVGTELFKATKDDKEVGKVSILVKGFTLFKKFIEVTLSEPVYVGRISSENERFINLNVALGNFFKHHKIGVFQSAAVDLYIVKRNNAFVIFDPRGRSMDCESNRACGEAALMVFKSIDNVFHLITNLSKLKSTNHFKISTLRISRITESKFVPSKFALIKKKCRANNFQSLFKQVSVLRGNLNLRSKIFAHIGGRQHLTASIMSIIYAKIDPPNLWSSDILDRVLLFGMKFYLDCIENGPLRDLKLIEIPSKFYVGDAYQANIAIVPSMFRIDLNSNFSDDEITKAIENAFKSSFSCLILQIDNFSFSVWQMKTSRDFFLYNSSARDFHGNLDRFNGTAMLVMFKSLDDLCKNVIERIKRFFHSTTSQLDVHALRIIELLWLSKKNQQKKLPKFVMRKCQPVCPLTASCANTLNDSTSKMDSVIPLLTTKQHEALRKCEEMEQKPEYLTSTDLNSESLVCHVKCQSFEEQKTTAKIIACDVYEKMMMLATGSVSQQNNNDGNNSATTNDDGEKKQTCNRFVTCAEKILLKTDLRCLQRDRVDVIKKFNTYVDPYEVLSEAKKTHNDKVSHFSMLPDKSAIVRGTLTLTDSKFPVQKIFNVENLTVITAISALITSSFHPIESWSHESVDNVISCALCMSEFIQLKHRFDFLTILEHRMPKVKIDNRLFNVKMTAIANGDWDELEKKLHHLISTTKQTSIVLVTSYGSLAIFSRQNFYYLFEYATCNFLGYRINNKEHDKAKAPADDASCCLLRFYNLHSLVKRIFANHPEMRHQQRFLICRVMVEKVAGEMDDDDDDDVFVPFSKSQEKEIVDKMLQAAMKKMNERLKPIEEKIQLEKERIRRYYDETGQQGQIQLDIDNDIKIDINDLKLQIQNDEEDSSSYVTTKFHYRTYDNDNGVSYNEQNNCHSMIIGSFAYSDDKTEASFYKPCHFACIFAYLFTMSHQMDTMIGRYVDIILENGLKIYEKVDESYLNNKDCNLNGIVAIGMKYDLKIVKFTQPNTLKVDEQLRKFFSTNRSGLLRGENGRTMLLFKTKKCIHVFNPYGEVDDAQPKAAFLQFRNIYEAIIYIVDCMRTPISIQHIRIVSMKQIKGRTKTAGYFLLTNDTKYRNVTEEESCKYAKHSADEKIDWIEGRNSIPWRYTASICDEAKSKMKKWKEYNVVIDNKLFSLYGNVHPSMNLNKSHVACSVIALVMAQLYDINEWDDILLDTIVAQGNKYYEETVSKIKEKSHRLRVNELSKVCKIDDLMFEIKVETISFGVLYADQIENDSIHPNNLNRNLQYVFNDLKLPGVLMQCDGKFLAIGNIDNQDYYMFDCQSEGFPMFAPRQAKPYVLKCCCMKILVACIVLTLNVRQRNVKFFLYEVKSKIMGVKSSSVENNGNNVNDETQQEGNNVSEQISKDVIKTENNLDSKGVEENINETEEIQEIHENSGSNDDENLVETKSVSFRDTLASFSSKIESENSSKISTSSEG